MQSTRRDMTRIGPGALFLAAMLAALASPGCTPAWFAKQADKTAYSTLARGQQAALGRKEGFDVAYHPIQGDQCVLPGVLCIGGRWISATADAPFWALLQNAVAGDVNGIDFGAGGATAFCRSASLACSLYLATLPATLDLGDCLDIAFRNSRSFQTQKEKLYTAALELANQRRGWNWSLLTGTATGDAESSRINKDGSTHSGNAEAALTFTQKLIDGGIITLGSTLNLASDLLGWRSTTVGSLLEANFTQPLLRGAGQAFAYEDQYRLERDFLFSVFEYERFTQTFAAVIATAYYDVLQQRDQWEIARGDVARRQDTYRITRVMWQGGQKSKIEADEAEQQWLNARASYEQTKQTYEDQLDAFKITLGLPIAVSIRLDYPGDLEALVQAELGGLPFTEDQAIDVALSTRPDVLRQHAATRDVHRNVEIAANDFLPQLDVTLGISAAGTEPRKFYDVRFDRHTRLASATFDYDLDQTNNRDAYRGAVIADDKAQRDLAEFLDKVRLEVRKSYRQLAQTRQTYQIRVRDVQVAVQRSALAARQQQQGLASTRDVTTAQDDLRRAQSGRTSALVSYTTTRLNLLASLGMLTVDEKGMFHEREQPFRFDRIAERYKYVSAGAAE